MAWVLVLAQCVRVTNMYTSTNTQRKPASMFPPRKMLPTKWPIKNALRAARERAKSITDGGGDQKAVQRMLAGLMLESGWDEADFIDELCKDVISRKNQLDRS
jgi:hypothetical protein